MVDAMLGCCRGDDFKPKVSLQIGKVIGSTRETKSGTEVGTNEISLKFCVIFLRQLKM